MDLVIANGDVIDGTARPRFRADVGVVRDRIAAVAPRLEVSSAARIDAQGKVIAPGFIDLHSHSDLCFSLPLPRQAELLEGRVRQGITTELIGNCGIGCVPSDEVTRPWVARLCGFIAPDGIFWGWNSVDAFLCHLERQGVVANVATLVAHGPARLQAMGQRAGPPRADEQARLDCLVRKGVEEGAFGVSFGLIYPPGLFAATDELVSVARAAAEAGGFSAFHQRGSSRETLEPAVREIIEVGRRAGSPVHHSHVESLGPRAWGLVPRVLEIAAEAIHAGIDLTGDVIPYTAVCTTMLALYPPWSLDGGVEAFVERLRDPALRRRMKEEVGSERPVWPPWEHPDRFTMNIALECGWDRIRLACVDGRSNKRHEHRTLADLGRLRGQDPFDALSDLLVEERGVATQLIFGISGDDRGDHDLVTLLRSPSLAFVTDAWEIGKGFPHPGAYGAFPRVLGHYARDRGVLSLEEAVARMSGVPAARLRLRDRGRVAEGAKADLVVFDPVTIGDRSTYVEPRRPAFGVEDVLINGIRVLAGGVYRPVAAGRVLRGNA